MYKYSFSLCLIFILQLRKKEPITEAERAEANKLKEEGNEFMRAEKLEEAIEKYSK